MKRLPWRGSCIGPGTTLRTTKGATVATNDALVVSLAVETIDNLIAIANTAVLDPSLVPSEAENVLAVLDAGLAFVETAKKNARSTRGFPQINLQPNEWTTKTAQLRHLTRILRSVYGPQMVTSD